MWRAARVASPRSQVEHETENSVAMLQGVGGVVEAQDEQEDGVGQNRKQGDDEKRPCEWGDFPLHWWVVEFVGRRTATVWSLLDGRTAGTVMPSWLVVLDQRQCTRSCGQGNTLEEKNRERRDDQNHHRLPLRRTRLLPSVSVPDAPAMLGNLPGHKRPRS